MIKSIKPGFPRLLVVISLSIFTGLLISLISACDTSNDRSVPEWRADELLPAGSASISPVPFASFDKPVKNIPAKTKPDFYAGRALAKQPWIKAPTATDARDGLGPLFNARSCLACHKKGGKGDIPADENTPLFSAFVRLSLPGKTDSPTGVIPEPVYGDQVQGQSTSLINQLGGQDTQLPAEAKVTIQWHVSKYNYPDGHSIQLRKPEIKLNELGYGDLHPDTQFSLRLAPSIQGAGLIDQIPAEAIQALADPTDKNNDGISGRVNMTWNPVSKTFELGRFGLKANRPDLTTTVAAAFAGDVGISNPLFPVQPCTPLQQACNQEQSGNNHEGFELPQDLLDLVIYYNRNIGVLKRAKSARQQIEGRGLFYTTGCADCHQPSFTTGSQVNSYSEAHLANQTVWPYSDFLLHDMGEALADHRSDFDAQGNEWRTAPLWGAGQHKKVNGHQLYLHDGRARTLEEAILWHGGEAEAAKNAFVSLPKEQRSQLIQFVRSL